MPQVLITGASTGIGRELAILFAKAGWDIALTARDESRLASLAKEIERDNPGVHASSFPADLARGDTPQSLFEAVTRRWPAIDALVNNAGFGAVGPFAEIPLQAQLDMVQVNIQSLLHLTRLFLPGMIQSAKEASGASSPKGGPDRSTPRWRRGILNVASTASFLPGPYMAAYYATKAFVLSFSEALASETAGFGLTVTALCPGPTRTEFQHRAGLGKSPLFGGGLMPVADARSVALAGYRAFSRGHRLVIPGAFNKLGAWATRLLPLHASAAISARINRAKYPD